MAQLFDLQGHRGARGLRPENTLPSFEAALDHGVTSIETDVQRTRDGVLVLYHDYQVSPAICRSTAAAIQGAPIRELSLNQVRQLVADGNPDPTRFPSQSPAILPLSAWFADQHGNHPYAVPTLRELFEFIDAYAGNDGLALGKTEGQRANAARALLDLEVKRVPFIETETVARATEDALLDLIHEAKWLDRCRVRSFDHRTVRRLLSAEPRLVGGVLVAGTAPVRPARLAADAGATLYLPDYRFLDSEQVDAAHAAGLRVMPWTVNEPTDWAQLRKWGVDGITTDYPDRLGTYLKESAG